MRRNQRNGRNVFFKPFLLYLLSFLLLINCTTFRSSKKKIFIYPISRNAIPAFINIFFPFRIFSMVHNVEYIFHLCIVFLYMYSISRFTNYAHITETFFCVFLCCITYNHMTDNCQKNMFYI